MDKFNMPLYTPGKNCQKNSKMIVADLHKKRSFLAYYQCEDSALKLVSEKEYATRDFSNFGDIVRAFKADLDLSDIDIISIAVPGPVINGRCETINLPWAISQDEIKADLQVEKVYLINDLEATAYSFLEFEKSQLEVLHTSEEKIRGNVAVLAPGHGLGEAGMFWDGENLRPFATEGGHTEFSPRNDFEVDFYQFMNKIYGIVTWENVLSKEGFYNIFRFLRDVGRHEEEAWVTEKIQAGDFLSVISETGNGKDSRLVRLTIDTYAEFLAREANNLVLKLKAVGALLITGDIPEKIFHLIDKEKFYKDFIISDRMEGLLKDIPIYLVRNPKRILEGAAHFGAYSEK